MFSIKSPICLNITLSYTLEMFFKILIGRQLCFEFFEPFLKTAITSASFKKKVNSFLLIDALIAGRIKPAKMLEFSLIIFVGTSISWQDFDASRLTVSLRILLFSTLENLNKLFSLEIFSITSILG